MTIKTLHLTNAWSRTSGGIATFYRALLDAGNRRGWPVCLVVPGERDSVEQVGAGRIYHVAARLSKLNDSYRSISPKSFLFAGSKIQQILAAEQPDLVEINDKYRLNYLGTLLRMGLAKDIRFRPVTVGLSCERMDRNFAAYIHAGPLGRAFCRVYMRWLYFPFFDHHIAVSRYIMDELCLAGSGHNVERGTWTLPMGVDHRQFSPSFRTEQVRRELLERAGGRSDSVLLLYVGRLAPEKNLGLLIDTLERLGQCALDYRLLVVGEGIFRSPFAEEASRRVPGRVTLLGHVADREELARIYANCDFFLHPNADEPYGIAPLEAMASGLILIAPDSGGIKEYASQQNACLVAPQGADFAGAISRVTAAPELRRRLTAAARATAEAHGWEAATDAYLDLYRTIYLIGKGKLSMTDAKPMFLSTPPGNLRRNVFSGTANLAMKVFAALSTLAADKAKSATVHLSEGE